MTVSENTVNKGIELEIRVLRNRLENITSKTPKTRRAKQNQREAAHIIELLIISKEDQREKLIQLLRAQFYLKETLTKRE